MKDALKRAARTFIQSFIGSLLTQGFLSATSTNGVVDWSGLEKIGIAALAAAVIAILTWAQNALENTGSVPTYLK